MSTIVRQLHLAFKAKKANEIYDTLAEQLLKAIRKYDPDYKEKVKEIVEVIDEKYTRRKSFTLADVNRHLEFDADRFLRMLVRRKHLEKVGEGFVRAAAWPPSELIEGEPIGFTYCVQTWFRYYLQQWISHTMSELEAKEGVYSLDFRGQPDSRFAASTAGRKKDRGLPAASASLGCGPAGSLSGGHLGRGLRRGAETFEVAGGRLG